GDVELEAEQQTETETDPPHTPDVPRPRGSWESDVGTPCPVFGVPSPAFGIPRPACAAPETEEGEERDRGQGRSDRHGQVRVSAELGNDVAGETDSAGGDEGRQTMEEATEQHRGGEAVDHRDREDEQVVADDRS